MKKEICWNITARCNQACKYCHRFLYPKDLNFNEYNKILDNLINSKVSDITWTGGEALLVENIEKLLEKSYKSGIKNKLITNGKLLTNEKIDKVYKYLDSITLSIDSINPITNKNLGRGEEHFYEIKSILDYIKEKKYDIKIRINSVICKQNINEILSLTNFLNNYNIYSWRIFKFMPLRELAKINEEKFSITTKEYNECIKEAINNSNIKKIDTREEFDMEDKYLLILANGDIVKTIKGEDIKVGNALSDSISKYL